MFELTNEGFGMRLSASHVLASLASIIAITAALLVAPVNQAQAANGADFDPGFLVSDADFFNGTALTAAQVDAFIAGMNKGCATNKTCIKNYREKVTAKAATTRCAAVKAATNQTAGQIIAAVGKACGISPKAILAKLKAPPRPFIVAQEFFGPDRRSKRRPPYFGEDRRKRTAKKAKIDFAHI